ncbi:MAG: hypothetical protein HRF43_09690 [Phycisphaerae bacterium]|jgi:hypothetical protein
MNRKRWVYLGLLIAAAGAFLVDRVFLSHPQEAEAKSDHASVAVRPLRPKPAAKPPAPKPALLDPSLAWLEKLADLGSARDAFSPSAEWLGPKKTTRFEEAEPGPRPGSPDAFQEAHQLQATAVMGAGGLAVVDQRCLKIGDVYDGYELVRVTPGQAEFRKGPDVARLVLPMPPRSDAPAAPAPAEAQTDQPARPPPPTHPRQLAPATRPVPGLESLLRLLSGKR